jgi:archaemetzincin
MRKEAKNGRVPQPSTSKSDPNPPGVSVMSASAGSPIGGRETRKPEDGLPRLRFCLGLVEMGRIGEFAVRVVGANIQTLIGIPVDILNPVEIPQGAYQHHRQQYDAGLVIRHLNELQGLQQARILGLVTADLCNPILTYVYGEAEIGGRVAVVSTFRLSKNEDGSLTSKERYYERLAKVALHEVAHTLSLYHCDDPQCLMHFSPKLQHLDGIRLSFCDRCEFMLHESLQVIARSSRSDHKE